MKAVKKGFNDDAKAYFKRLTRSQVLLLEEYSAGPSQAGEGFIKISANENDFGVAPSVLEAVSARLAVPGLNRYPDSDCAALREALSRNLRTPPDWFLVGNGLDDVIQILAMTFISHEDEVIIPAMSFGVYESVIRLLGAMPVMVPMRPDLSIDVAAMAGAVTSRTKMVILCNPNNPTGTIVGTQEFDELVEGLAHMPLSPLLVVDQAYVDYVAPGEDYPDVMKYARNYRNIVALRTFSKISGMAGFRVGYAIARPGLLSYMYRVRQPYTVNSLAQAAAVADVSDESAAKFKKRTMASVAKNRERLEGFLGEEGIPFVRSQANFVFAFYDRPYEDLKYLSSLLAEKKILVRTLRHENAPCGIRFSIGTDGENDLLIDALSDLLPEFRGKRGALDEI
ncbi:MAG: aminotransferase class I/II-fold pyridoxal phosphate-dependent enzyme [Synergistaceae bacterium]|jgi:histidinol-phosphate aminotransferase|nr:aminotransferase class I/II-fold pyridoxal phosphate-dependent enzyme [Synergistaceae bacterium]